jgi:hypothetical protein
MRRVGGGDSHLGGALPLAVAHHERVSITDSV